MNAFHKYSKPIAVFIVLIITLTAIIYVVHLRTPAEKSDRRDSVLIPLYSGNSAQWQEILNLHAEYKNVGFYVIVNPDNGSGNASNATYASWIDRSEAAGITVLGYVFTSYGNRSISSIEDEVSNYTNWYGLHSIFFDEVSDNVTEEAFYLDVVNQSHAKGINFTVGNPGDFIPTDYISIFNVTVIYENPGYPVLSTLREYAKNVAGRRLGVIVYAVPFSESEISGIGEIASTDYFSDQNLPDPYQNLSSYLPQIAQIFN